MWLCSCTVSRKFGTRGGTRWLRRPTPASGPSLPTTADTDYPTLLPNPRRPRTATSPVTSLEFSIPLLFPSIAGLAAFLYIGNSLCKGQRDEVHREASKCREREAAEQEKTNHKPNPNKHRYGFSASMKIAHYIKEYGGLLNKGELRENITVSLDGQILNKMSSSDSKRFFYDLQGGSSKVQIVADPRNLKMDEFEFSKFYSCISPGDFIGVTGFPGKTNRGDLSIFPRSFIALSNRIVIRFLHHRRLQEELFPASRPEDEPSCFGIVFLT